MDDIRCPKRKCRKNGTDEEGKEKVEEEETRVKEKKNGRKKKESQGNRKSHLDLRTSHTDTLNVSEGNEVNKGQRDAKWNKVKVMPLGLHEFFSRGRLITNNRRLIKHSWSSQSGKTSIV